MIIPSTGEIDFTDGLRITAHTLIGFLQRPLPARIISSALPIEGWGKHILGNHSSAFGYFSVEVVTGKERRVEGVFLSHTHSFYEAGTPRDSERRALHEGVIASDLFGQQEFSWGHVFCRLDRQTNQDWLIVIYSPFSSVPLHQREVYKVLMEHESTPNAGENI